MTTTTGIASGPLKGIRIVEFAGIGPAPMAAMTLADMGSTVLRIDRPVPPGLGIERPLEYNLVLRNRQSIALDLKDPASKDLVLELLETADALIEGFRPGTMERLGLGPEICLARNPRLVYGRMTGWGQDGPLARAAGHDLNYIALTGVLNWIGREKQPPTPPLNLVGDYAGGGLYLALGILAAILEARNSGQGQIVDAAIVDGTAALATSVFGMHEAGMLGPRGENILDSGAPYYDVYECADGCWVSVAPIEDKFYQDLLDRLEIDATTLGRREAHDYRRRAAAALKARFKSQDRDYWCRLLEGTDACFAPVLSASEAPEHPHLKARRTFVTVDGITQPAAAPRFSRTGNGLPVPPAKPTKETGRAVLAEWLGAEKARSRDGLLKG